MEHEGHHTLRSNILRRLPYKTMKNGKPAINSLRKFRSTILHLALALELTAEVGAQCDPSTLVATYNNPARELGYFFGNSVSVSGNLAVVGSAFDDPDSVTDTGTGYVFDATTSELISVLSNPAPATADDFGRSVAISGDLVVVGAPDNDPFGVYSAGSAYIFNARTGALIRVLRNPHSAAEDEFGISVAISGRVVVVGAWFDDPSGVEEAGTAYVFNAITGELTATLRNPSPSIYDRFGCSVAVSGNMAVVGAYWDDPPGGVADSGGAYVFDARNGALISTLFHPEGMANDQFGISVAVSGDAVVVGAWNANPGGLTDAGAVYVFDAPTGALTTTLYNPAPTISDSFGFSVAVSGDRAIVGAKRDDPEGVSAAGVAYIFDTPSGDLTATLSNPVPVVNDWFGHSVAISDNVAVVSSPLEDFDEMFNVGTVYIFSCRTLNVARDWVIYE